MSAAQIVYHHVPVEVTRVSVYAWQPGGRPIPLAAAVARDTVEFVLTIPEAASAVVLMHRAGDGYLVDGPLMLRGGIVEREIDPAWRHTIAGTSERPSTSAPPLDWLASSGTVAPGGWPACWWTDASQWECMGVPIDAAGVVMGVTGASVLAAVATGDSTPVLRATAWGRLVIVGDGGFGPPPRMRLSAARAVSSPQRVRGLRLETVAVSDVRTTGVEAGVYWIAGDSSPPDSWLEIRSGRSGPEYLPLAELTEGSPQLPLHVTLEDRRDLVAVVLSSRGDPASGALVTAFRVIDPWSPSGARDQAPPRRVLAGEAAADAGGVAHIDGLGHADYELVAWHPQLGRAGVRLAPAATEVTVHLDSPGMARGRVLVDGKPAPGVDIISVPDPVAYASAADPVDVKGGDARTTPDGRFWVALAQSGGGELRVGGGSYPIVRVPLPRGVLPLVDIGDVELGRPVTVAVTLDQDPGCELRATGPVGRTGLQTVAAARTGPGLFAITLPEEGSWEFVLLCGRTERALSPAIVRVSRRDGPRDVRLTVR